MSKSDSASVVLSTIAVVIGDNVGNIFWASSQEGVALCLSVRPSVSYVL